MCQHGAHATTGQGSAETTLTVRSYRTSRTALAWVLLMLTVALTLTVALLALIVVLSLTVVILSSAVLWLSIGGSTSVGLVVVVL